MIGYVYLMINPAFPDLIKIGRTAKTTDERASELFTTGTPGKFIVAFELLVEDCIELEREMHELFSEYRYAENREFFQIPLKEAINALQNIGEDRIVDSESVDLPIAKTSTLAAHYIYCAFIGDVYVDEAGNRKSDKGFFRFGIVTKSPESGDVSEFEKYVSYGVSEIKKTLVSELVNYYNLFIDEFGEHSSLFNVKDPSVSIELVYGTYIAGKK